MPMMTGIRAALLMLLMAAGLASAAAQTYPTKPIRLIVPFGAGGPVDVMARLIAQKLSVTVGAVIVENKPGQGGTNGPGHEMVARPRSKVLHYAATGRDNALCGASPQP